MALFKMKDGQPVKVSNREMRETIMRANGWTLEEYHRQYDLFKNKLRFYESVQASRGVPVQVQSPIELLYKTAKAKIRYGADYEPSQEMRQIEAVTAHSITKGRRIAQKGTGKAYKAAVSAIVNIRFGGFIDYYGKAREIVETISDPVKQEEALKALAEFLHERMPRPGKDKGAPTRGGEGGIAYGETYGSGDEDAGDDFDISAWLD